MTDDIDELAAELAKTGWADKPKGLGFTPEEQAMADALLADWAEPPAPTTSTFEWSWASNTLGRQWRIAQLVDGRRLLLLRGFTQESLDGQIKRLRREGHIVREAVGQRAAAA